MSASVRLFPGVSSVADAARREMRRLSRLQRKVKALEDLSPGAAAIVEDLLDEMLRELREGRA